MSLPQNDLRHFIRAYDGALDADFCGRIVTLFESLPQHQIQRQRTYGPAGRETTWRWTQIHADRVPQFGPFETQLKATATRFAERYARDVGYTLFPHEFEEFKIKRYSPSGSECFPPHVDVTHTGTMHRMLAVLWYLNDVDEGGETLFGPLDHRVAPRCGRLLMFPPFWMYPHAGMAPRSNAKYIVGTYLKYRSVPGATPASGAID